MAVVTITRRREYDDVFSGPVSVPPVLEGGLRWIQAHCPLGVPTAVMIADLATAWEVPESVVRAGLHSLSDTGFFTVAG